LQISDQIFDEWVRQYHRLLFGIAYWWTGSRADAEELAQEAFYQAYRSRSSLRDLEMVKGWLVGILRNCYAQMNRRGHCRAEVPLDDFAIEYKGSDPLAADTLALRALLERLDERHRLPLVR
jgi:DNA-directed RNA polymerase specialized sigma24 family protein